MGQRTSKTESSEQSNDENSNLPSAISSYAPIEPELAALCGAFREACPVELLLLVLEFSPFYNLKRNDWMHNTIELPVNRSQIRALRDPRQAGKIVLKSLFGCVPGYASRILFMVHPNLNLDINEKTFFQAIIDALHTYRILRRVRALALAGQIWTQSYTGHSFRFEALFLHKLISPTFVSSRVGRLQTLDIGLAQLSGDMVRLFLENIGQEGAGNLKTLDTSSSKLQGQDVAQILACCSSLQRVRVDVAASSRQAAHQMVSSIASHPNLKYVTVDSSIGRFLMHQRGKTKLNAEERARLNELDLGPVFACPNLVSLRICNQSPNDSLHQIRQCQNLTLLSLEICILAEQHVEDIAHCQNLRSLRLSLLDPVIMPDSEKVPRESIISKLLQELSLQGTLCQLETLNLSGQDLNGDLAFPPYSPRPPAICIPSLRTLDIRDTAPYDGGISVDCIKRLISSSFPGLMHLRNANCIQLQSVAKGVDEEFCNVVKNSSLCSLDIHNVLFQGNVGGISRYDALQVLGERFASFEQEPAWTVPLQSQSWYGISLMRTSQWLRPKKQEMRATRSAARLCCASAKDYELSLEVLARPQKRLNL